MPKVPAGYKNGLTPPCPTLYPGYPPPTWCRFLESDVPEQWEQPSHFVPAYLCATAAGRIGHEDLCPVRCRGDLRLVPDLPPAAFAELYRRAGPGRDFGERF
ncbi:hypothetical protein VTI28DRAFT_9786 [Corynascus sepedonium]